MKGRCMFCSAEGPTDHCDDCFEYIPEGCTDVVMFSLTEMLEREIETLRARIEELEEGR